jgi:hypothetical protein
MLWLSYGLPKGMLNFYLEPSCNIIRMQASSRFRSAGTKQGDVVSLRITKKWLSTLTSPLHAAGRQNAHRNA